MALHVPIGHFKKPALGWIRYREASPVLTSLLADDLATAPSRPVNRVLFFVWVFCVCLLLSAVA